MTDVIENEQAENTENTEVARPTNDKRIPSILARQSMLKDFCLKYLWTADDIAEYNGEILAEKDSEWNGTKLLAEAKKLGNPDEGEADADIKKALDAFEAMQTELRKLRQNVIAVTAEKKGIVLSSVTDRDPEKVAKLKEERKTANTLGEQFVMMAKMTSEEKVSEAITQFLRDNELPMIGREQARNFSEGGTGSTPKYRTLVNVYKKGGEGEEDVLLFEGGKGFSKTAIELSKPVFGYERGKALGADKLREVWENAGNSQADPYKVPEVTFLDETVGDNGEPVNLLYMITAANKS